MNCFWQHWLEKANIEFVVSKFHDKQHHIWQQCSSQTIRSVILFHSSGVHLFNSTVLSGSHTSSVNDNVSDYCLRRSSASVDGRQPTDAVWLLLRSGFSKVKQWEILLMCFKFSGQCELTLVKPDVRVSSLESIEGTGWALGLLERFRATSFNVCCANWLIRTVLALGSPNLTTTMPTAWLQSCPTLLGFDVRSRVGPHLLTWIPSSRYNWRTYLCMIV